MWSFTWHFTNRSVTEAPYNIKVTVGHTAGHYGEEYDDCNSDAVRADKSPSEVVSLNVGSVQLSTSMQQNGDAVVSVLPRPTSVHISDKYFGADAMLLGMLKSFS